MHSFLQKSTTLILTIIGIILGGFIVSATIQTINNVHTKKFTQNENLIAEASNSNDFYIFATRNQNKIISPSMITTTLADSTPAAREFLYVRKYGLTGVDVLTSDRFVRGDCPIGKEHPNFLFPVDRSQSIGEHLTNNLVEIQENIRTANDKHICLEETTAIHLEKLFNNAQKEGHNLIVTSGYRDPSHQARLYHNSPNTKPGASIVSVVEPGHSEHQLGTTVDISGSAIGYHPTTSAFGQTKEMQWLQSNAHKYGFILSFPEDSTTITGVIYEPWHWRFVGIENATKIYNLGHTPIELLKKNNEIQTKKL